MDDFLRREGRKIAIGGAWLVYLGVIIFAEAMFLSYLGQVFAEGPLGLFARAGAIAGGLSAAVLPLALHRWLAPGAQFLVGVVFWLAEVLLLSLNVVLAFAVWRGLQPLPEWLEWWSLFSPATPLAALLGWGLLFLLDPEIRLMWAGHVRAAQEMESGIAQLEAEIDQRKLYTQHFRDAAKNDPGVSERLREGARRDAARFAARLTGDAYPASGPVIDGEPARLPEPAGARLQDGVNGHKEPSRGK